jgi:hypothetical protein
LGLRVSGGAVGEGSGVWCCVFIFFRWLEWD